jgi:hypothetical protein
MKAKLLLATGAVAILVAGCNFKSTADWKEDKGGEHRSCLVLESKLVDGDKSGDLESIVGKCQFYYNGKVVDFVQRPLIIPTAPFAPGTTILMSVDGK